MHFEYFKILKFKIVYSSNFFQKVKVIGDSDPKLERIKKIEVSGKGIAIGKAFQQVNNVLISLENKRLLILDYHFFFIQNEFWIDGRAAGIKAELSINIKNPERASTQLKINDMGDGTFKVDFRIVLNN